MKLLTRVAIIMLFTLVYAMIIGLGSLCFLNIAVLMFWGEIDHYPRFAIFCLFVGILALVALLIVFFVNVAKSKFLGYGKLAWTLQSVISLAASLPAFLLWDSFFRLLQNIF